MREARLWHPRAEPLALHFKLKTGAFPLAKPLKLCYNTSQERASRNPPSRPAPQAAPKREGWQKGFSRLSD